MHHLLVCSHRIFPWALAALLLPACHDAPDDVDEAAAELRYCEPHDYLCDPGGSDPQTGDPTACSNVYGARPTTLGTYTCSASVLDKYGRPIAGLPVTLESVWCGRTGYFVQGSVTGYTDANGYAEVGGPLRRGNQISCAVVASNLEGTQYGFEAEDYALSTASFHLAPVRLPDPTTTRYVPGLAAGSAEMQLFQSGPYDRVLVIPEPFDPLENMAGKKRSGPAFWKSLEQVMVSLHGAGWDIWLVQPSHTGENLHEQAAELAQAIQLASTYGGTPGCGGGKVSVLGVNTAGVVARLATARWEADAAWRAALSLSPVLPVNALGTGDSPHYGMHLNRDLQSSLFANKTATQIHEQTNLDSCAMAQLLKTRYDNVNGGFNSTGHQAFFSTGSSFTIRRNGVLTTCAGGPPLATLNAERGVPGWPSSPWRFGWSNGHPSNPNTCAGGAFDLNGDGANVCKYIGDLGGISYAPRSGDSWVRVTINGAPDRYLNATAADLLPGSRSPLLLDGLGGHAHWGPFGGNYYYRQRFSPTMIESASAAGLQGPGGTRPSPFQAFEYNSFNGVADRGYLHALATLQTNLNAANQCPP